jgi:hypothetical protein
MCRQALCGNKENPTGQICDAAGILSRNPNKREKSRIGFKHLAMSFVRASFPYISLQ